MSTYLTTAVYHDGHLYGIPDGPAKKNLNCAEAATGKLIWSKNRFPAGYGAANVTLADGNLYILTKEGELVVAPATPKGYQEKGRSRLLEKVRWVNAPTIAGKKLYARDYKNIICVDIAGN